MDEGKFQQAAADPTHRGEMADADSVGSAGSPGCGDMMRIWLKYRDEGGKKVIDKASFDAWGCETAIAVASVATGMLEGKSVDEARNLRGDELAEPLGSLPPMKIHCATLVEEALRYALEGGEPPACSAKEPVDHGLAQSFVQAGGGAGSPKIVFKEKKES